MEGCVCKYVAGESNVIDFSLSLNIAAVKMNGWNKMGVKKSLHCYGKLVR